MQCLHHLFKSFLFIKLNSPVHSKTAKTKANEEKTHSQHGEKLLTIVIFFLLKMDCMIDENEKQFIIFFFHLNVLYYIINIFQYICFIFSGAILYIWYSIVTLYRKLKEDEEANTGVQMAYVDETPSQLPPYSVLTIDK